MTFGLKAAGWLAGLDDARRWLEELRLERLAAQLGGAAGHARLARRRRAEVADRLRGGARARRAGAALAHAARPDRRARVGARRALGRGREGRARHRAALPDRGRRGPRGARAAGPRRCRTSATRSRRSARSRCAQQAPGLAATLLGAMAHEHERAAGVVARGVAPARRSCCARPGRPSRGCASRSRASRPTRSGCAPTSSDRRAADGRAGRRGGGSDAADAGGGGAQPTTSAAAVAELLGEEAAAELLDPSGYLGSAGTFVDRALDDHDREG